MKLPEKLRIKFGGTTLSGWWVATILLAASVLVVLALALPSDGKDSAVTPITPPIAEQSGRITEFFWYQCPHCKEFDPMFDEWTKTVENKTKVEKVPVSFGAAGDSYQSIYYTLQAMGQLNKYHAKLFQTAQSEPNSLLTKSNCVDWAQAQGIDSAVFSEKFDSPEVRAKVERAKSLEQAYQVVSVPSIGVFGLALVSPGGTWQNFLDKVQLLMELNKSVWTD